MLEIYECETIGNSLKPDELYKLKTLADRLESMPPALRIDTCRMMQDVISVIVDPNTSLIKRVIEEFKIRLGLMRATDETRFDLKRKCTEDECFIYESIYEFVDSKPPFEKALICVTALDILEIYGSGPYRSLVTSEIKNILVAITNMPYRVLSSAAPLWY